MRERRTSSQPEFSPNQEILRRTMKEFREINRVGLSEIVNAYNILKDPINEIHLANPPKDEISLILAVNQKPSTVHYYGGINALGELAGVASINDASGNINSHEIGNFAVRSDLQRQVQRDPNDRMIGVGRFMLEQIIREGFETRTWDGRERSKLRAGVMSYMTQIQDGQRIWVPVPRADVMIKLLKGRGFSAYTTNPDGSDRAIYNQVTKEDPLTNGKIDFAVTAFELHIDDWKQNRREGMYASYNEHNHSSAVVYAGD